VCVLILRIGFFDNAPQYLSQIETQRAGAPETAKNQLPEFEKLAPFSLWPVYDRLRQSTHAMLIQKKRGLDALLDLS
jgi:hypothetical protein